MRARQQSMESGRVLTRSLLAALLTTRERNYAMTSLRWDNVPKPRVERPPLLNPALGQLAGGRGRRAQRSAISERLGCRLNCWIFPGRSRHNQRHYKQLPGDRKASEKRKL
jgi:hypothetical protein